MPEITVFDHYEVLRRENGSLHELGRGAMGITYKAYDTNLRCPVALKVINAASIDSEVARQRFVREARSAAQLRHRHVASVFHLGIQADTYFYAMEFIEGETVESLVRRLGPLQPILAFRIAVQVARALNAAQRHQLVHRDLKPSNLMLVREDEEVVVKVIDFGLAKSNLVEEGSNDITMATGFVGTPHFASPEQLEEAALDVRSDIYSLGITLWYMLVGEAPFQGSLAQVMSGHLNAQPPVERLRFLPDPARDVILEMLAKKAGQRPGNAMELRARLEACIETLGQTGTPDPSADLVLLPEAGRHANPFLTANNFHPGTLLAGRYELLRDLGENNSGWCFQAEDLRDSAHARLLILQAQWASDPEALAQIDDEAQRLRRINHPGLLKVLGHERSPEAAFILLEWTEGFSLLELLRSRGELHADEALLLLRQLAPAIDAAINAGLRHLDFSMSQVLVAFKGADFDRGLSLPVDRWPAYDVKVNALGITRDFSSFGAIAAGHTIVGPLAAARNAGGPLAPHYVQSLGAVIYELLGGTLSPLMLGGLGTQPVSSYTPLAALGKSANDVVENALDSRRSYSSAAEFCTALESALAADVDPAVDKGVTPSPPGDLTKYATLTLPPSNTASGGYSRPPAHSFPPVPIPRISWLGLAAVMACATAAGGLWMLSRPITPPPPDIASASATPVPDELPAVTPPPQLIATPSPSPASTPDPNAALKAALQQAADADASHNWKKAIQSYVDIIRAYPAVDAGREKLGGLLTDLRPVLDAMPESEFASLQPPVADAAAEGVPAAMVVLAGRLTQTAPVQAYAWYCGAAALGDAYAMTQAGIMVSNGAPSKGQTNVASGTTVPRDYPQAFTWFQMAANAGDAAGETCLAECYLYGTGVQKDEATAVNILRHAAAADPRAMNLLGTCLHRGTGTEKNFNEAFQLFTRAYELGFEDAAGNLGVLYINGDGVPQDATKAVSLFTQGAQRGDSYCMYLLAKCYQTGAGIHENRFQAEAWYRKAAQAGDAQAIEWCRTHRIAIPKTTQ